MPVVSSQVEELNATQPKAGAVTSSLSGFKCRHPDKAEFQSYK